MKKALATTIAVATLAQSGQAMVIAHLYNDYTGTYFSTATIGTTPFITNNWRFYQGFSASTELTYSETLGTRNGTGFGGDGFEEVALVSAVGVFDQTTTNPNPGELTFHPRDGSGAPSDLHIRWTADQNYPDGITIDYNFRTPSNSDVGFALGYNSTSVSNITVNWQSDGVSGTVDDSVYAPLSSVNANDTIEIIIFNRGDFGGDQTFGNLVINAVPEPSSALLAALGALALIRRRR